MTHFHDTEELLQIAEDQCHMMKVSPHKAELVDWQDESLIQASPLHQQYLAALVCTGETARNVCSDEDCSPEVYVAVIQALMVRALGVLDASKSPLAVGIEGMEDAPLALTHAMHFALEQQNLGTPAAALPRLAEASWQRFCKAEQDRLASIMDRNPELQRLDQDLFKTQSKIQRWRKHEEKLRNARPWSQRHPKLEPLVRWWPHLVSISSGILMGGYVLR